MAEALFLVKRVLDNTGGHILINGVKAVIFNAQTGKTTEQYLAQAVDIVNLGFPGPENVFPSNYFNSVDEVSDLFAGPLKDDGDGIIVTDNDTMIVQGTIPLP